MTGDPVEESQDEIKRKFREALDAKKRRVADSDPNDNRPGQQASTHGAEGGRRMFRRKSGS